MACSVSMKASGCFWGKLSLAGGGFSWDERMQESGRFTVYYLFGGTLLLQRRSWGESANRLLQLQAVQSIISLCFRPTFLGLVIRNWKTKKPMKPLYFIAIALTIPLLCCAQGEGAFGKRLVIGSSVAHIWEDNPEVSNTQ